MCNENKVFAVVNWTSQILISLVGRYCFQFNAVNIAAGTEKFFQQVLKGFFCTFSNYSMEQKNGHFLQCPKSCTFRTFLSSFNNSKNDLGHFLLFSLMQFGKCIRLFRPSYGTVSSYMAIG